MIHFDEHIFQMGWFNHQAVLDVDTPLLREKKRLATSYNTNLLKKKLWPRDFSRVNRIPASHPGPDR